MAHISKYEAFHRLVHEQRLWIDQCGGNRVGYIDNYHGKYGRTVENAEAIYEADMAALKNYTAKMVKFRPR